MILLLDIGNTNTHAGLADAKRIRRHANFPTRSWANGTAANHLRRFCGTNRIDGVSLCSVVPEVTPKVRALAKRLWKLPCLELTARTIRGVTVNYPKPDSIGPDRLANAVAVKHHFGAPAVVVDFGTAVTFDVVDRQGNFVGGIIAPGLSVMTDYLHEKTALLPRIRIRQVGGVIGKSTAQAMLIGAVHGYRGLVRELIAELKHELKAPRLPVVATGGFAKIIASNLPEISAVKPNLTLEGVRLVWVANRCIAINDPPG